MLIEQINQDYITAAKERNADKVNTLRLIKSALKNEAIKIIGADGELDDTQAQAVLNREAKQRKEAIEQYKAAERADLVTQEEAELALIESYLPKGLSDNELSSLVTQVIAETGALQKSDMGKVMGALKAKITNPADVSRAAAIANQHLA